jgi:hypothetical protein
VSLRKRVKRALCQYSWADAETIPLDQLIDGTVAALATRKSDKKTLAIAHTLIDVSAGIKQRYFRRFCRPIWRGRGMHFT